MSTVELSSLDDCGLVQTSFDRADRLSHGRCSSRSLVRQSTPVPYAVGRRLAQASSIPGLVRRRPLAEIHCENGTNILDSVTCLSLQRHVRRMPVYLRHDPRDPDIHVVRHREPGSRAQRFSRLEPSRSSGLAPLRIKTLAPPDASTADLRRPVHASLTLKRACAPMVAVSYQISSSLTHEGFPNPLMSHSEDREPREVGDGCGDNGLGETRRRRTSGSGAGERPYALFTPLIARRTASVFLALRCSTLSHNPSRHLR